MHSYQQAMETEFGRQHDNFRLIGQDNFRRYLPVKELRVRIHPGDTCFEILARVYAAHTAGCRVTVSKPLGLHSPVLDMLEEITDSWAGSIEFVEESDEALADVVRLQHTDRLRYAAPDRVPLSIREAVIEHSHLHRRYARADARARRAALVPARTERVRRLPPLRKPGCPDRRTADRTAVDRLAVGRRRSFVLRRSTDERN